MNLAYAEALHRYGSNATVLNRRILGDDGGAILTICEVDTKGIEKDVLKAAIEKPISQVIESSEGTEITESVAQIMELIQSQSGLKHNSLQEDPKEDLLNDLLDMGFEYRFSQDVIDKVLSVKKTASMGDVLKVLSDKIPFLEDDIIAGGGWVSVMGPTGVGKTTTLSKLASLYTQYYSKDEIALVTVDTFRVGAVKQLQEFASLIGVDFYVCESADELMNKTKELSHKRLVLLDTAGKSQKDKLLHAQLRDYLSGNIKNLLVLNAGTQLDVLENTIEEFKEFGINGLVLTKLDEVMKLGSAISAVCKHNVPVQYLTTGQQVPQDIEKAEENTLMRRACDLAGRKWVK